MSTVLSIAVPVGLAALVSNLISSLNTIIIPGRLIVNGMNPGDALGAFGVTFGMTMPLLGLPFAFVVSICLVVVPRLSEHAATRNREAIRADVRKASLFCLVVVAGFTAILLPWGAPLARFLFKNENAGMFLAPLLFATGLGCFEQIFGSVLNGLNCQTETAANRVASGVLQLILTWVLIPLRGLEGFVWAILISSMLGMGLCWWDVRKQLRL